MTDLDARYGRASPRAPERPMAFRVGEFLRGAGLAWLMFNASTPIVIAVWLFVGGLFVGDDVGAMIVAIPAVILFTAMIAMPWSFGATLIAGLPLALGLGLALRTVATRWVHAIAFGVLGAIVGVATVALWLTWDIGQPQGLLVEPFGWVFAIPLSLTAGVTVALGWWLTSRWALRADARASARLHPSPNT